MTRAFLQAALGAAIGWVAGSMWASEPDSPPAPTATAQTATPEPDASVASPTPRSEPTECPDNQGLQDRLDSLETERLALVDQLDALRQENDDAEGIASQWPLDLASAYHEEAFTQQLQDALDAAPEVTLAGLDCVEFPCIFAVQADADGSFDDSLHKDVLDTLRGAYPDAVFKQGSSYAAEVDGVLTFGETMALIPPGGLSEEATQRLGYRLETFNLEPPTAD